MIPFEKIIQRLEEKKLDYKVLKHEPAPTSEDSARVRNCSLDSGVKALVIKAENKFLICAISASKRLSHKKLQSLLQKKKSRFATAEELFELTELKPGAVPPFGLIFNLPTLVDNSVKEQEIINFNAGDLCVSISMQSKDYLTLFHSITHDITE